MKQTEVRVASGRAQGAAHRVALAAALAGLFLAPASVLAGSVTYTLDAQFDVGALSGVNHDTPTHNQLQLSARGTTFPVLWLANAGEDTLTKFDTSTNKELARYRTWFAGGTHGTWLGPAPSRTAVDLDGNAYVLNRHFDGRPALLLKVLAEGYIDRNGNGVMDTSSDLDNNGIISGAELKPLADTNGNGVIDPAEIQDERVAWAVPVGGNNGLGRALCIGTDQNLWVGLYNAAQFYKVSSATGAILQGPVAVNWTPYGCAVDGKGILWSASLSGYLGRVDTTSNPPAVSRFAGQSQNYGIALGNGRIYLGSQSGQAYEEFNPPTSVFTRPAAVKFTSTGISVDGDGNIVTGRHSGGGVVKYRPDGSVIWNAPTQFSGADTRGPIVDANGDVWQMNINSNTIAKHRGTDGGALGVFPVGVAPYTYSDATGLMARTVTNPTGTWTVIQDGGAASTRWGKVSWNASVPADGSVEVRVRAAETPADLTNQAYAAVASGVAFDRTGRYLQVQARLNAGPSAQSPLLYDLTAASLQNLRCDLDGDGDVDKNDINSIFSARGTRVATGDPRDFDGDRLITVNDARACTLRCTRPSCAVQ